MSPNEGEQQTEPFEDVQDKLYSKHQDTQDLAKFNNLNYNSTAAISKNINKKKKKSKGTRH